MPLIRRIPKRGFNNARFSTRYAPVNIGSIERRGLAGIIDEAILRQSGLVNGRWDGVKILAQGEIKTPIQLKVHAISASARAKIEAAGGTVEIIKK
jgi:large subunit ribosomal protein L15